jgi:ubiquinol-cytochrome c reductase cytochrome b subunit
LAWMAAVLLVAVLGGLAITGQMLPMDDEAVGGASVAGSLAAALPGAGALVRGGEAVGEPMLGRFFVAHTLWYPSLMLVLLAAHAFLVARHGIAPGGGDGTTVLECVIIPALGAIGLVVTLATLWPPGVERAYDPAVDMREGIRPMWPFLPAYQLLNAGVPEIVVALAAPTLVTLAACLPLGGRPLRIILAVVVVALIALGVWGALANRAGGA